MLNLVDVASNWRPRKSAVLLLSVLLIIGLTCLRFVHLGADTPYRVSSDIGLYVDEGYKTFSARNLVLFGDTNWNRNDNYSGWMGISPGTQWAYYGAFRILGVRIQSVRALTILAYCALLLGYFLTMHKQYPPDIFFFGLIMLGLQNTLFFFSRVALFEIPMAVTLYLSLFLIKIYDKRKPFIGVAATAFVCLLNFQIKPSALLYSVPIVFVLCMTVYKKPLQNNKALLYVLMIGAIIFGMSMTNTTERLSRLSLSPETILEQIFILPPLISAPFLIILGLLCVLEGLLYQRRLFTRNTYRLVLVSLMLLGPLMLAFKGYNPPRYYIPFLPAYLLFFLEWWNIKRQEQHESRRQVSHTFVHFAIVALIISYSFEMINQIIVAAMPLNLGEDPGLGPQWMFRLTFPLTLCLTIGIWKYRKVVLSRRPLTRCIFAVQLLFLMFNFYKIIGFISNPSYQLRNITQQFIQVVPPEATIAGDWAPLFTLNSKLRSLYMTDRFFNTPDRIKLTRPDYYLHCDVSHSRHLRELIMTQEGISLGEPVLESFYNQKKVVLYPIIYTDQVKEGEAGLDDVRRNGPG